MIDNVNNMKVSEYLASDKTPEFRVRKLAKIVMPYIEEAFPNLDIEAREYEAEYLAKFLTERL